MQQWRVRRHRRLDIDDVRQHLVLDLDQLERLGGDNWRGGGDGGHRVALVQHLVARHDIARQVAEVHRPFAHKGFFRADLREIGGGHDRLTPGSASAFSASIFRMRA